MDLILKIELFQAVVLGISGLAFLFVAAQQPRSSALWTCTIAMACFAAMLRELDPELLRTETYFWANQFGRKVLYRFAIGCSVGLLAAAFALQRQQMRRFLDARLIVTWLAAIALMAIGSLFEKQGQMLLEEIFELAGQLLVLLSAWLLAKTPILQPSPSPHPKPN
ncbi:hypothetical protein [Cyanobium sp. FACHB-13342]|uniref:hypothetical protein n=1 Tax=Cyanobium sp. FACHB-13342 TaxID=2692793 RepID=UPI001680A7B8|nr:hypothetical protein [Cyanobium sp. FACHB-13342]MBD2423902.1 hypothetical protein [Cyanobium sp. FACHB-13342]